jgi:hypothetical protein
MAERLPEDDRHLRFDRRMIDAGRRSSESLDAEPLDALEQLKPRADALLVGHAPLVRQALRAQFPGFLVHVAEEALLHVARVASLA